MNCSDLYLSDTLSKVMTPWLSQNGGEDMFLCHGSVDICLRYWSNLSTDTISRSVSVKALTSPPSMPVMDKAYDMASPTNPAINAFLSFNPSFPDQTLTI